MSTNTSIDLDPIREFQQVLGGSPWDELTPQQQQNWIRLYRGELDWDGNPTTPPTLNGQLIDLDARRPGRLGVPELSEITDSRATPEPIPNDGPSMHDLVIQDFVERKAFGLEKYGTLLQAHNGRPCLTDAYQEVLDLAVYLRQAIVEQGKNPPAPVVALCGSMRFVDQIMQVAADETAKGHIVVAPFSVVAPEDQDTEFKAMLDRLHFEKIDMSSKVIVVTVDGYIGASTMNEIHHSIAQGKTVEVRDFPNPVAATAPDYVQTWTGTTDEAARWLRGATSAGNPLYPAITRLLDEREASR